jgi:hypothetical protein
MIKLLKQGFSELLDFYYVIGLPILFVYFPNFNYLFSPPAAGAGVELGDVPPTEMS